MMAPTGVPREIIMTLHGEVVKAMASAEVRKRMQDLGSEVVAGTPEEFGALQKAEIEKWAKVIKAAGVKLD